jgi:hypothetical protein
MGQDDSAEHEIKWANEYKAFDMTPFTHTIKLEADMLWTVNTDWWWNHLWQHDLVFSVDCRDYRDNVIKETPYRKLVQRNHLPNIYNGLMYFRRSKRAQQFYDTARDIVKNWNDVKTRMLINCHDEYPSTDVVFALAYRIMDPNIAGIDRLRLVQVHTSQACHTRSHEDERSQRIPVPKQGGRRCVHRRDTCQQGLALPRQGVACQDYLMH